MAIAILKRSDKKRYGDLQTELFNNYLKGKGEYQEDVPSVLNLFDNYKPAFKPKTNNNNNANNSSNGGQQRNEQNSVSFLQSDY